MFTIYYQSGDTSLPKWKILNKNKQNQTKQKQEIDISINEKNQQIKQKETKQTQETHQHQQQPTQEKQNKEYTPIKTYKETLYSSDHPQQKKKQLQSRQRWETAEIIGKNIDDINTEKKHTTPLSTQSDSLEHKIDALLSKKGLQKKK